MIKIIALHISLLFSLLLFSQSDLSSKKYLEKNDKLKSSQIFNFYVTNYSSISIDSVMVHNSKKLEILNKQDYVIHELARVLYYKTTFKLDSALILLDKLNNNETIKKNIDLNASYQTLFGIICYDLNRPITARSHYTKGLELYSELRDSVGVKGNLVNIGTTYFIEENYDSAEIYFEKAQIFENLGVLAFHENLTNNFATVYQNTNRYNKAIESYLTLIEEGDQTNTTHYYNLGLVYYKNKEYSNSVDILKMATEIEYDRSNIYLSAVYSALSKALQQTGKINEAYQALNYSDSLKVIENKEDANRLLDELKLNNQEKIFEKEKLISQEKIRHKEKEKILLIFILGLVSSLLILLIVLFILKDRKNRILARKNIELTLSSKKVVKPKKESNISLEIIAKVDRQLIEKEVFINSKITLDKFAKQLNTNRTYLSENINSHYQMSFSMLINQLRIKKAREMLLSKDFTNYSIEGISSSVGFNSLSTFNTCFKKETGITPSYFRRKGQESL